jgi:uncharacterized protein YjiS (DUF1127 family)
MYEVDDLINVNEDRAPRGATRPAPPPTVFARRGVAGNDPLVTHPEALATGPWALHALAANGFGDGAYPSALSELSSYELMRAARARRARVLGEMLSGALRTVASAARKLYASYRQQRAAATLYGELTELDDHALKDLGFDRSELRSVAAEVTGAVERTRVRAQQWS